MENGTKTTTESAVAAGGSTVVVHSIGQHPEPCPSCGRCPTCGRGGYQTMPVYPVSGGGGGTTFRS